MEQTQYNLLFRWFIGLSMGDAVWVPTIFTKNRERLTKASVAKTAATMAATAATSKVRAAAVTRTSPAPTPMLGCTAKATTPADCAT